ncbi:MULTISPECIES: prepilin-type N-terminal cleavage/methylation domain-containing protein [Aeromonas]|uniref:Prepilin-type N-terminal cleavage/methylation domain-containing protein n=2 Tax=Aeromonas veronii TaxID=654 RepID=A0A3A9ICD3_AERVE|nr:prepilin-type N-terminal cleavage/methylation domain-containing protein [Aeromonas veronii]AFF60295.1 MshA [Aeromonas veronii bv. sobria]EKP0249559.1 prepilin-type N-terminal cleavage/methylation domain-containing protein [Aeromonas veronii]ELV7507978.1 prepilin-type N-terminal cleavage/methylation domain-containing protein [Aeromonas veronii]MCF5879107.1 prepilin-type N-terminal cleavage/methylation domain-containing protein [Aeromonas veronii]MCF5896143.1 prepilin-type N-terminal cleavage
MKKQAGFTLIELVIVIIILGILAVTAAPKFLNLQDDARKSAAQGVQSALQSAANLVYSKAALEGQEKASAAGGTALTGMTGVKVIYGYPTADTVSAAVTLDGWKVSGASATSSDFYPDNTKGNECYVTYTAATSETVPFKVELKNCK